MNTGRNRGEKSISVKPKQLVPIARENTLSFKRQFHFIPTPPLLFVVHQDWNNRFICPKGRHYQLLTCIKGKFVSLAEVSPMLWFITVMHKAENFINSALQHSPLSSSFKIYEMSLPSSLTFEEFTQLISSLSIRSMCVFSLWTYSPKSTTTITVSNYTIVDSSQAWKLCIDCYWCCKWRKDIMHAVFSFSRHIYVTASIYAWVSRVLPNLVCFFRNHSLMHKVNNLWNVFAIS